MKETYDKKAGEIADILLEKISKKDASVTGENTSFMAGQAGIVLFLAYYFSLHPDPQRESLFEQYADECLEKMANRIGSFAYCGGLSGSLEVLRFLNENLGWEVDYTPVESGYRALILDKVKFDLKTDNYDYLHGALGMGLYFRNDPEFVEATVDGLLESAVREKGMMKWRSYLGEELGTGYNICLSHGMSSIILILCRMYACGVRRQQIAEIIEAAMAYILTQLLDPRKYGCFFPSQSLENGGDIYRSRLGWCYGDLGIAAALWQAGCLLGHEDWKSLAGVVMDFSAARRDPFENHVLDAGLCHGSAGAAMSFLAFYERTGNTQCRDAALYWMDYTLQLAAQGKGPAGYRAYHPRNEPPWEDCYEWLEGIAGIGTLLLTGAREDRQLHRWTDLMLL